MANWYCDHGCTLYPSAYMSVPASAASLPQDGDGKASGTGATPAVASASWDLTSASASSGTMTIMGASVTGLTGSGSTLASAIVTAINASTAAVTAANGNATSVYLKGLVWATSSGATLTVYTRIASADLNYSSNTACQMAIGTGWTGGPSAAQFSGGVSGPWANFINTTSLTAAFNADGTGVGVLGAFSKTPMGNPAAGDVIKLRAGRGASNITVESTASFTATLGRLSNSLVLPITFEVDDGTVWSDSAGKAFTLQKDGQYTVNQFYLSAASLAHAVVFKGKQLTSNTYSFRLRGYGVNNASGYAASFNMNCRTVVDGFEVVDNSTGSAYWAFSMSSPSSSQFPMTMPGALMRNGTFKSSRAISPWTQGITSYNRYDRFEHVHFDFTGLVSAHNNAFVSYAANGYHKFELKACKWTLPSGANKLGFSTSGAFSGYFEDCDFGNLIAMGGYLCGTTENSLRWEIYVSATKNPRALLVETPGKLCEWRNSSYPTRNAVFPGNTPMVQRMSVSPVAGAISKWMPVDSIRMSKNNELPDGTRTLTLNFLVDANFATVYGHTPRTDEIFLRVSYVDTSGNVVMTESRPELGVTGSALTSGTGAEWSTLAADINGAPHSFSAYKASVTLTNLAQNSEVATWLCVGAPSSSVSDCIFIDPDFSLA